MEQIIPGALDKELILPMDLIKAHCKIDDTPGIITSQIELYRDAAMEAAEIYTQVRWFSRAKIEQEIVSPRFRGLSQAAGARQSVELEFMPLDGIVNVYGTGPTPLLWYESSPIRPDWGTYGQGFFSIKLPPDATRFEIQNDLLFIGVNGCDEFSRQGSVQQNSAKISYIAGVRCEKDVPAGIKVGCLKAIAWMIENPGDQFVPMVIRQVGVTTITNNPMVSSGALDDWRRYRKKIAT